MCVNKRELVTTGWGQGSLFGDLIAEVDNVTLGPAALTQSELYGLVNDQRLKETTYKSADSE